jgi:hypothetical protein
VIAAYTGWADPRNDPKRAVVLADGAPLDDAVLSALAWMASGFSDGIMHGLFTLVTGPIAFLLSVLTARVAMELVLAIFRIAEHIEKLPTSHSDPESRQ